METVRPPFSIIKELRSLRCIVVDRLQRVALVVAGSCLNHGLHHLLLTIDV